MPRPVPLHDYSKDDSSSIYFDILDLDKGGYYDTSVPHRHNYYELFLFIKGGGVHEIDFESISIESASIHFLSPGQVHFIQRLPGSYGYVIMFSREFYSLGSQDQDLLFELPFFNGYTSRPLIQLSEEQLRSFENLVKEMKAEREQEHEATKAMLHSYLNILLLKSKTIFNETNRQQEQHTSPSLSTIYRFKMFLEKNYRTLHLVKDYADLLSISPEHLNDTAKRVTGQTASELITRRIVLEMKRLLMYSELSNKEIAYFMNYDDPSYFSRFFKKRTGLSPSGFRKQTLEKYQK